MATTDITALAREARAATDEIIRVNPPGRTASGRTCADLAAELSEAIALLHDAVAEAEAFIDITVDEPLTDELQDTAALGAAALFLGRRLFESNAAEICELHPELRQPLIPVLQASHVLAALSRQVLSTVEAPSGLERDVA